MDQMCEAAQFLVVRPFLFSTDSANKCNAFQGCFATGSEEKYLE